MTKKITTLLGVLCISVKAFALTVNIPVMIYNSTPQNLNYEITFYEMPNGLCEPQHPIVENINISPQGTWFTAGKFRREGEYKAFGGERMADCQFSSYLAFEDANGSNIKTILRTRGGKNQDLNLNTAFNSKLALNVYDVQIGTNGDQSIYVECENKDLCTTHN